MGGTVTKVATVEMFDSLRGLLFHKGTYIEAPPEFFTRYDPKDMVNPKKSFDPKRDYKVTITSWEGMPKKEEQAAAPVVVEEVKSAVEEPKKKVASAMTSEDAAPLKKGKGRRKAS